MNFLEKAKIKMQAGIFTSSIQGLLKQYKDKYSQNGNSEIVGLITCNKTVSVSVVRIANIDNKACILEVLEKHELKELSTQGLNFLTEKGFDISNLNIKDSE